MSAIVGTFGHGAASSDDILAAMLGAMPARGPDGSVMYRDSDFPLALGLSFLRTRPDEPEPTILTNEDGTLFLACDGQVFNDDEIANFARGRNHTLQSGDPREVFLHLFEEEGVAGWKRVDGQFALALWNRRRRQLWLARDFLGVCPLYFATMRDGVVFASEIKALLRHPAVPCAVDAVAVDHYLTFLNVPGPRTLFADISRVPAGSAIVIGQDGQVRSEAYWDLLNDAVPERDDESFYVDRVRELHSSAVSRRRVDSPLAALVSGGNDSSANAAYLAREVSGPLHTITVGLAQVEGQARYNDIAYARQVAELIGSKHHQLLLSTDEFLQTIPITVDALDDMVSEPSSVFLYHALRLAREAGAKVVITGEANDELSCGHGEMNRIRNSYYERWLPWQQRPLIVRRAAALAASVLAPRRRDVLHRAATGQEFFWSFEIGWDETEKGNILTQRSPAEKGPATVVARHSSRLRASEHGRRDYLSHIIYLMMQDLYFGNLMLGKLGLLAGHVGIEPRCPYTDPAYAHFVFNVPAKFKFRDNTVKAFFKKALAGVLPDSIIYRPKQGFRTPVVELFKGKLGDWARPVLMEGGLTRTGMLHRDHLDQLLQSHRRDDVDHSNKLWTAMVLNLWYDRWIRNRPDPRPVP